MLRLMIIFVWLVSFSQQTNCAAAPKDLDKLDKLLRKVPGALALAAKIPGTQSHSRAQKKEKLEHAKTAVLALDDNLHEKAITDTVIDYLGNGSSNFKAHGAFDMWNMGEGISQATPEIHSFIRRLILFPQSKTLAVSCIFIDQQKVHEKTVLFKLDNMSHRMIGCPIPDAHGNAILPFIVVPGPKPLITFDPDDQVAENIHLFVPDAKPKTAYARIGNQRIKVSPTDWQPGIGTMKFMVERPDSAEAQLSKSYYYTQAEPQPESDDQAEYDEPQAEDDDRHFVCDDMEKKE